MANVANVSLHSTATSGVFTLELLDARETITVINRGSTDIYFTCAGGGVTPTAPVVGGNDSFVVPGVVGSKETVAVGHGPITVSLICSGSSLFSVQADGPVVVTER